MGKIAEIWVSIGAKLDNFNRGMTDAQNAMQKTGKKFQQIGKQMTLKISAPLLLIAGAATKVGADFEQAIVNAFSVTGSKSEEVKKQMEDLARTMGETTVFSAKQAADALYFMASAGYKAKDMSLALEPILNLSAATQSDLAFATDTAVASLNQFQLGAEGAERVSNVFAAAISNSQATMEKLSDSMKYVGPIFNSLGKSVEEASSVLMQLYNSGYDASMAGTALRMSIAKLLKPTKETKDAIARLGLSMKDVNPETHKFADIIELLGQRGAKTKDIMEIFGVRAGPAMAALIAKGGKAIKDYEKKITGTKKASEMADQQINTLKGSFRLLTSALTEAAIQISKVLAPIIKSLVDELLIPMVKAFSALPQPVKVAMLAIAGLAASAGPLLFILGKILTITPMLIATFVKLKAAVLALSGPFGIIVVAALAVGKALDVLINKYKAKQDAEMTAIVKSSNKVGEAMALRKKLIENEILTVEEWKEIFNKHGRSHERVLAAMAKHPGYKDIRDKLEKIKEEEKKVEKATDELGETFSAALKKPADVIANTAIPAMNDLRGIVYNMQETLKGADFKTPFDKMVSAIYGARDAAVIVGGEITKSQQQLAEEIRLAAEKAYAAWEEKYGDWLQLCDNLGVAFGGFVFDVLDKNSTFVDNLKSLWDDILGSFRAMIADMVTEWVTTFLKDTLYNLTTKTAKDVADTMVSTFTKAGAGAGKGFTSNIGSLFKSFNWGSMLATSIGSAVGTFVGGLFNKTWGKNQVQLLRDIDWWIKAMYKLQESHILAELYKIKDERLGAMFPKFDSMLTEFYKIRDATEGTFNALKGAMFPKFDSMLAEFYRIRDATEGTFNALTSKGTVYVDVFRSGVFEEMGNDINKTIADMGTNVEGSIKTMEKTIGGKLVNVVDKIGDIEFDSGGIIDVLGDIRGKFDEKFEDIPGANIPEFQTGGVAPKDMLARLHKGEVVVPPDQMGSMRPNIFNIHISAIDAAGVYKWMTGPGRESLEKMLKANVRGFTSTAKREMEKY